MHERSGAAWLRLVVALQLAACGGDLMGGPQVPVDSLGGAGEAGVGAARADGGQESAQVMDADGCALALAAPRAVLLTPRQYVNVLTDVLGPGVVSAEDAASDDKLEFDTVDLPRVTTASLDHALRLAERAVAGVRGKSAQRLGCAKANDGACVRKGLAKLARRAFKRPAGEDELDGLMAIYEQARTAIADEGESAVGYALTAMLVAPSTLYRTEFSGPRQAQRWSLSAHERAAALSALLLDSVPDEALLAAADDGSLAQPAVLAQQLDRLLALPRTRAHLTRVMLDAFKVPKLFETPKDEQAFPGYTRALQQSMFEETRRFVERVLWQNEPLGALLSSSQSFVDPALAKLYGVPYPGRANEFAPVQLPAERSGLLTQASVLSVLSRTEKTSVVARGLFVRGNVLCLPKVPSPPMSIQAQIEEQLEAHTSERELAAYRAKTSPCKGCHAGFDAFGLLLEEFDAIGRHSGKPATAVELQGLGDIQGSLSSPVELARMKVDDGSFTQCLTRRTVGYALSVASQPLREECAPDALTMRVVGSGGTLRDLLLAIAQSPEFTERNEEL